MKPRILVKNLVIVILLILSSLITFSFIDTSKAETAPKFYVDDDYTNETSGWGVDHFDSIQDAINAASSGDRILIYDGTYSENLIINSSKSYLDLFGEDRDNTIISGGGSNDVIIVNASHLDIGTLTVKDSGSSSNNSVIRLTSNAGNCVITDCIISDGQRGVFIESCNSNTLYANTITNNAADGIYLNNTVSNSITYCTITSNNNGIFAYTSDSNTISHCDIKGNSLNGIYLNASCDSNPISYNNISSNTKNGIYFDDHCDSNTITNNQIHHNSYSGIRLENSSSNTLGSNTINSNTNYGLMVVGSSNTLHNSTLDRNGLHGVFLFGDDNSQILDNSIKRNVKDGIRLQNSTSDIICRNRIIRNSRYGVYLNYYALNNQIYNNFLSRNADNARDISQNQNTWYITPTLSTNIIGGAYISGNYWENYDETSEGASDSNGNGIADTAKSINISSSDSGALLDTVPPVTQTPTVSPSSQSAGSYTYISVRATDNVEIKDVRLIVTNPNSQTSNISIKQNKTGNTYYCNKQYSAIGDYSFYIRVKDARNWGSSDTVSFSIHAGDPPSITVNSATTGSPGKSFTFNATITSGSTSVSNLTGYVNYRHGSISGNVSMTNTAGNYFEKTITLDRSISSLTYFIYAKDQWGNSVKSTGKSVTITDIKAPTITVERYGSSSDDYPNSFTFKVKVNDDTEVSTVYIEYWYANSEKMIANMDNLGSGYYQKVIIPSNQTDRVYCVIYANDTSENQADTKNPYADPGGPYSGYVIQEIKFDGTSCFDLDGNITDYTWSFGDGNTGKGVSPSHAYSAKGNYTATLTLTDNDGNTKTDTTQVTIIDLVKITTSSETISDLEEEFGLTLNYLFYSYDTDGDSKSDVFVDPNNIITVLHSGHVEVNNHASFLLSINGDLKKTFIWDSETDTIINVTYQTGSMSNSEGVIDEDAGTRTLTLTVKKSGWIYFEVQDHYTDISNLTVKRSDGSIVSSDMIWRKNNKIYVLDDPDTTYYLVYSYISSSNSIEATFLPSEGSTIDGSNPKITIYFNMVVTVLSAEFYRLNDIGSSVVWEKDIIDDLVTRDGKTYSYTPPEDLTSGIYYLDITVENLDGTSEFSKSVLYNYTPYATEEEAGFPFQTLLMIIGSALAVGFAIFFILKRKKITFESFIYIKNKKIIPFFKPVVFGPLKIKLDNTKSISKAEFFVNGMLKETVNEEPYTWIWNEPAFMKQNIETKIYDENGKGSSSGEMTFYMFNPGKMKK